MKKVLWFAVLTVYLLPCSEASGQNPSSDPEFARPIDLEGKLIEVRIDSIRDEVDFDCSFRETAAVTDVQRVRELAEYHGLLSETSRNPHLRFLGGDLAFWAEQGLSEDSLRLQFAARKVVLDEADEQRLTIDDQGKLSWAAGIIMADFIRERNAYCDSAKTAGLGARGEAVPIGSEDISKEELLRRIEQMEEQLSELKSLVRRIE